MGPDIKPLIAWIRSWEGGFVNDPDDAGGATYKGITLATFRAVYGQMKTVDDLKRLTEAQWEHIFRTRYWDRWRADQIDDASVAYLLVGWVWGSGVWGVKVPQRVLGVPQDGIVGPRTLAAINGRDGRELFDLLKHEKAAYFERICVAKPSNRKFLKGWLRRLDSLKYGSLTLNTTPAKTLYF